tara:strand:+ start:760 stop:1548 length:789 start_codon:yes stop_codon:yes gene_type:complete
MDETSLYQAATQVRQASEPAISDIYAQATSLKPDLTGGSDEYFETSGDKNQVFQLGSVTTEEDQDTNATTPFSITVNGSTAASGVQTSPFTLDCIAGTGEYPARSTGTSPQVVTYASPDGVSVAPPSSGTTMFVVYAKVAATMTATAGVDVATTGTIVISETSAAADKVGSNTRYVNNGSNSYTFFFLIGNVAASRRSDGRYSVRISQIQEGNYTYGNVTSTTATAGGATVSTKDGLRKFTICINGEPFTADIDVSNIVKVT